MKTIIYPRHLELGAKMVNFSGWEMPIEYQGILLEHQVVRSKVGLFDVSHMGRIFVSGTDAAKLLDYISTNEVVTKQPGSAIYTVWCDEQGRSIDDLIIYKHSNERFFVVVNAGNRDKDLAHLKKQAEKFEVQIQDRYGEEGILAIQGPMATSVLKELFLDFPPLKKMQWVPLSYKGKEIAISSTGYTGEEGYEIYADNDSTLQLWDQILGVGKKYGIEPIGLGARDTLRLEMGYALYGHELSEEIPPIESVAAWAVKVDKKNFLGKEKLESLLHSSELRVPYGITLLERGVAREGYAVYQNENRIGMVTSGTFSPSLKKSIALILSKKKLEVGDEVEIEIRRSRCRAQVVQLPFYRKI